MAIVLRAQGVSRRFGSIEALRDVDFSLHEGEAVAVIGPNGAGKTTLLRLLAGTDRPDDGVIEGDTAAVGWAPQRPAVYPRLTVRENLSFFVALESGRSREQRVDELIERANLESYARQRADRLSTGTLQRLHLAVALGARPHALLLDEPTATLSPDQRVRLWQWVDRMRALDDVAVAFSSQSLDEAGRHADRLVAIVSGRVAFTGTHAELAALGGGDAETGFLAVSGPR